MVLSIGMIVKNEEKYLERCLTALKPILDEISSELIIADTGSTDNTVEIAKKFTDNVYHFKWINDFAAARNSTLKKARGEWYMFIDADEILQDCKDIIRFFKSGEYRKFNSATYIQRSYQGIVDGEIDLSSYVDIRPLRLSKRFVGIVFKNPVHEAISPYYYPTKHLDTVADHFGYLFRVNGEISESAIEKHHRNLKILLKIVEEAESEKAIDVSVYSEISDCYLNIKDKNTALEYLYKGLNTLDKSNIVIVTYFSKIANILVPLKRYEEALSVCDRYFSNENQARTSALATDTMMYFYSSICNYYLYQFETALSNICSFFDLYEKYNKNELNTNDLIYNIIGFPPDRLRISIIVFYDSCMRTGKYDIASKRKIPFEIKSIFNAQKINDKNYMYLYVIIFLDRNLDLTELVTKNDFSASECVHIIFAENSNALHIFENYDVNVISKNGLEQSAELFKYALGEAVALKADVTKLLKQYGNIGIKWQDIYKNEQPPAVIQAAIMSACVVAARNKKNYKLCIVEMKNLLSKFPEFALVVKLYQSAIENEMRETESQNPISEFERLAISIKRNIRFKISSGNTADAESLLREYEELCPNDIEIKTIKEEINNCKSKSYI